VLVSGCRPLDAVEGEFVSVVELASGQQREGESGGDCVADVPVSTGAGVEERLAPSIQGLVHPHRRGVGEREGVVGERLDLGATAGFGQRDRLTSGPLAGLDSTGRELRLGLHFEQHRPSGRIGCHRQVALHQLVVVRPPPRRRRGHEHHAEQHEERVGPDVLSAGLIGGADGSPERGSGGVEVVVEVVRPAERCQNIRSRARRIGRAARLQELCRLVPQREIQGRVPTRPERRCSFGHRELIAGRLDVPGDGHRSSADRAVAPRWRATRT
jgi:hypothetical protein